jgi:hypothetical protein
MESHSAAPMRGNSPTVPMDLPLLDTLSINTVTITFTGECKKTVTLPYHYPVQDLGEFLFSETDGLYF